jgi:hypothetical protein
MNAFVINVVLSIYFIGPRLIIKTAPITTTIPEPSTTLGFLAFSALGMRSLLKRKHHQI